MSSDLINILKNYATGLDKVAAGAYLFHQGDAVKSLYVVDKGLIELTRFQADGIKIILQRAWPGTVVAEASVYSKRYHCSALAAETTQAWRVPLKSVLTLFEDTGFLHHWSRHLAAETQQARFRSELLGRKTVAARLDGWLNWFGGDLPARGSWKQLAQELAVSPEALYREMARRRRES